MSGFERYFQDSEAPHPHLKLGMSGIACRNLRSALIYLDYPVRPGDDFDAGVQRAVRQFQADHGHKHKDGVLGPGTCQLLIRALIARYGETIFQRLDEPGPPPRKKRPKWCPGDFAALPTLVDRDAPELESILTVARRALGCGFGDYLNAAGENASYGVASAMYDALRCSSEVQYDYEPANPGEGSQEVRIAREVLGEGVGTCLDLALLFAALLERGHVAPAVALLDLGGPWHAMAGYFRELDSTHRPLVLTDAQQVQSLVEEGALTAVEVTGLSAIQGVKKDFCQARWQGQENFRRHKLLAVVNVLAARAKGILPITMP